MHKNKGEIALTFSIISLIVMVIGTLVGTRVTDNQFKTQSNAQELLETPTLSPSPIVNSQITLKALPTQELIRIPTPNSATPCFFSSKISVKDEAGNPIQLKTLIPLSEWFITNSEKQISQFGNHVGDTTDLVWRENHIKPNIASPTLAETSVFIKDLPRFTNSLSNLRLNISKNYEVVSRSITRHCQQQFDVLNGIAAGCIDINDKGQPYGSHTGLVTGNDLLTMPSLSVQCNMYIEGQWVVRQKKGNLNFSVKLSQGGNLLNAIPFNIIDLGADDNAKNFKGTLTLVSSDLSFNKTYQLNQRGGIIDQTISDLPAGFYEATYTLPEGLVKVKTKDLDTSKCYYDENGIRQCKDWVSDWAYRLDKSTIRLLKNIEVRPNETSTTAAYYNISNLVKMVTSKQICENCGGSKIGQISDPLWAGNKTVCGPTTKGDKTPRDFSCQANQGMPYCRNNKRNCYQTPPEGYDSQCIGGGPPDNAIHYCCPLNQIEMAGKCYVECEHGEYEENGRCLKIQSDMCKAVTGAGKYKILFAADINTKTEDLDPLILNTVNLLDKTNLGTLTRNFSYYKIVKKMQFACGAYYVGGKNALPTTHCANEQLISDLKKKCGVDTLVVNSSIPNARSTASFENNNTDATANGNVFLSTNRYFQLPHEFGHAIANLADEYSFGTAGPSNIQTRANCSSEKTCKKWACDNPEKCCVQNCVFTNWYRPSEKSIMSTGAIEDGFNKVSLDQWQKVLSTSNSNGIFSQSIMQEKNQSFALNIQQIANNMLTVKKVEMFDGPPDKPVSKLIKDFYTIDILDTQKHSIYTTQISTMHQKADVESASQFEMKDMIYLYLPYLANSQFIRVSDKVGNEILLINLADYQLSGKSNTTLTGKPSK